MRTVIVDKHVFPRLRKSPVQTGKLGLRSCPYGCLASRTVPITRLVSMTDKMLSSGVIAPGKLGGGSAISTGHKMPPSGRIPNRGSVICLDRNCLWHLKLIRLNFKRSLGLPGSFCPPLLGGVPRDIRTVLNPSNFLSFQIPLVERRKEFSSTGHVLRPTATTIYFCNFIMAIWFHLRKYGKAKGHGPHLGGRLASSGHPHHRPAGLHGPVRNR